MRTCLAFFSLLFVPCFATAQENAAAQAAQAAQQAAQQSQQAAMQAMQDSQNSASQPCCISWTAPPKFSVKPGKYGGPTTVRITDASRGAVIYYSTDGWTPTVNSPRYRGPIVIDSTTTLQAIAIAPYSMRSLVTSAQYTIAGTPASSSLAITEEASGPPANVVPVPLLFDADVSSRTALVGDKVPMVLSQDLKIGNFIVKKGTPATVTITQVDRTGIGGAPGTVSFEVDDLHPDSGPIPLQGSASREGEAKPPNATILIPLVGPLTVLKHGTDAVITKGTPFTAFVDLGTPTASAE